MGRDLVAVDPATGERPQLVGGSFQDEPGPLRLADPEQRLVFRDAADRVRHEAGIVDGGLKLATLDTSTSIQAVQAATGWDPYTTQRKTPAEIRDLLERGDPMWEAAEEKTEAYAAWSAKLFLEACAELDLSIECQ